MGVAQDADSPFDLRTLTPAERRVLGVALRGTPVKEIAAELGVSAATIASHLSRIYGKVGVRSRAELLARASQPSVVGPGPSASSSGPNSVGASPLAGLALSGVGLVAGLLIPLSSIVLGLGLIVAGLRSGASVFGWARPVVLVVGAALVLEAALIVFLYSVS